MTLPDIDFHNQCTAAQRRARAIATAPRRNRNDDDDDNEFDTKTSQPIIFISDDNDHILKIFYL